MSTARDPREHYCEACDAASASYGFDISYVDDAGALASVRLWFCREHRPEGERLLTISNEAHGSGHAARPRLPRPDTQPAPAPAQGSLDL